MTKRVFSRMAAAAVSGLLLTAGVLSASAEEVKLGGAMTGTSEVPPNDSPATGNVQATLDTATRKMTWTVTYSGLTGPASAAHFHGPSEHGKNAGVVLPFSSPNSPITGSATITEAQAADVLAGRWYANVHTAKNPGGEIRAQLVRTP